jgi:hypothetical protein
MLTTSHIIYRQIFDLNQTQSTETTNIRPASKKKIFTSLQF